MVANATISPLASAIFSKLFKLATSEGIHLVHVKFIICWKLSTMTHQRTLILSFSSKRFFFKSLSVKFLGWHPYTRKMNIIGQKGCNTHLFHRMKKWAVKGRKPLEYCHHVTTLHEYPGTLLLLWKAFFVRFFCVYSPWCAPIGIEYKSQKPSHQQVLMLTF